MRWFAVAFALLVAGSPAADAPGPIVDSDMTFEEALGGQPIPEEVQADLRLVTVRYWSFDRKLHEGQILCNRLVVDDVEDLFELLEKTRFPIRSAIPVSRWNGSDSASMANDNTSAFAWRTMWGSTTPSWHMKGLALDVNPRENPAFKNGAVSPPGARLDPRAPGTLSDTSHVVVFLKSRGWKWGARWRRVQDWQHLEKPVR